MEKVIYYTDGACSGNGKEGAIGGWAWVLTKNGVLQENSSDYIPDATNNIAEMQAVIEAMKHALQEGTTVISIASDSAYVINGATEWMYNWARNGWYRNKARTLIVKNKEMWQEIYELTKKLSIDWIKVKGHSGDKFNEMADHEAKEEVEVGKWKMQQI